MLISLQQYGNGVYVAKADLRASIPTLSGDCDNFRLTVTINMCHTRGIPHEMGREYGTHRHSPRGCWGIFDSQSSIMQNVLEPYLSTWKHDQH